MSTVPASASNAATILIHPSSILYTTTPNQEGPFDNENTLIDGSGLSSTPTIGNYLAVTHAGFTATNSWATVDPIGFPSDFFASGGLPQTFVIQLEVPPIALAASLCGDITTGYSTITLPAR